MEDKIRFLSNGHEIEGRLEKNSLLKGVVITHPHPLYGGDMHNNVVNAVARVYRQNGYSSLRFNFRGVGSSQGSHGNGIGEQADDTGQHVTRAEAENPHQDDHRDQPDQPAAGGNDDRAIIFRNPGADTAHGKHPRTDGPEKPRNRQRQRYPQYFVHDLRPATYRAAIMHEMRRR